MSLNIKNIRYKGKKLEDKTGELDLDAFLNSNKKCKDAGDGGHPVIESGKQVYVVSGDHYDRNLLDRIFEQSGAELVICTPKHCDMNDIGFFVRKDDGIVEIPDLPKDYDIVGTRDPLIEAIKLLSEVSVEVGIASISVAFLCKYYKRTENLRLGRLKKGISKEDYDRLCETSGYAMNTSDYRSVDSRLVASMYDALSGMPREEMLSRYKSLVIRESGKMFGLEDDCDFTHLCDDPETVLIPSCFGIETIEFVEKLLEGRKSTIYRDSHAEPGVIYNAAKVYVRMNPKMKDVTFRDEPLLCANDNETYDLVILYRPLYEVKFEFAMEYLRRSFSHLGDGLLVAYMHPAFVLNQSVQKLCDERERIACEFKLQAVRMRLDTLLDIFSRCYVELIFSRRELFDGSVLITNPIYDYCPNHGNDKGKWFSAQPSHTLIRREDLKQPWAMEFNEKPACYDDFGTFEDHRISRGYATYEPDSRGGVHVLTPESLSRSDGRIHFDRIAFEHSFFFEDVELQQDDQELESECILVLYKGPESYQTKVILYRYRFRIVGEVAFLSFNNCDPRSAQERRFENSLRRRGIRSSLECWLTYVSTYFINPELKKHPDDSMDEAVNRINRSSLPPFNPNKSDTPFRYGFSYGNTYFYWFLLAMEFVDSDSSVDTDSRTVGSWENLRSISIHMGQNVDGTKLRYKERMYRSGDPAELDRLSNDFRTKRSERDSVKAQIDELNREDLKIEGMDLEIRKAEGELRKADDEYEKHAGRLTDAQMALKDQERMDWVCKINELEEERWKLRSQTVSKRVLLTQRYKSLSEELKKIDESIEEICGGLKQWMD